MRQLIFALGQALLLTCVAEACPAMFMKRRKDWLKSESACNVLTNPLLNVCLWFVQAYRPQWMWWSVVLIGEVAVVIIESLLYWLMMDLPYKRCFAQSALCNTISFTVGLCFR